MYSRKSLVKGVAIIAVSFGLVGCGNTTSTDTDSTKLKGINPSAELDYDEATVHFPGDDLTTTDRMYENELLIAAGEGVFIKCVKDKTGTDLPAYPIDPEEPVRDVFFIYGPWTKPVAEKFAFLMPMTDGELSFNGYIPRPDDYVEAPSGNPYESLSQEQRDEFAELCGSEPEYLKYDIMNVQSTGPGQVGLQEVQDHVASDPRTKALVDDLDDCFQTLGMDADRNRIGYPTNADSFALNQDQINLALQTVECKDQINFTQRVADITTEYQMKVIDEYGTEMMAEREKWDNLVQDAKDYIAANPDLFIVG